MLSLVSCPDPIAGANKMLEQQRIFFAPLKQASRSRTMLQAPNYAFAPLL